MTELKKVKVKRKFNKENLKDGISVTIRQWDDMKEEFGVDSYGTIRVPRGFSRSMVKFCGSKFHIGSTNVTVWNYLGYFISPEMLEECYQPIRQLPDHLKGKL